MARYPKARWDPISGSAGAYTSGPWKLVWHKTQGASLAGARSAYKADKSDPHFTVHPGGVNQHIDTGDAARSLRNEAGGVQTGRDCAIQIEIVGYSGESMDDATMNHLVALVAWIAKTHGIAWVWPEGRPPQTSAAGYGTNTGERHPVVWDGQGGHYGHSQVPENRHWDPAFTDREWWILNALCGPQPQAPGDPAPIVTGDDDMATKLVDMPAANGYGLAEKFVDFGREVVPVSATLHGPNPTTDGWWNDSIGANARMQPRGTGVVVTVDGVKNSAAVNVWVTVA